MSLGLGEAVTAIEVVIELWHKVKDAQDEVDKMGKQLEQTKVKITHAKQLIPKNKEYLLRETNQSIWSSLQKTVKDIQEVAQQAEHILRDWFKISSHLDGAEWTNIWIANFAAVVKQNPGRLRNLRETLVEHQNELQSQIQMLILSGTLSIIEELHKKRTQPKPKPPPSKPPPAKPQPQESPSKPSAAKPPPAKTPLAKPPLVKPQPLEPHPKPAKPKSPSPSPQPPPKSIIFVDSNNTSRSVLAQSYMMLVREWTTRTKNHWPVQKIDSAGLRVTSRSAFAEQLKSLHVPVQMYQGNTPAKGLAINALFDQPFFNYQYKAPIRRNAASRKSRGIPADIFSSYDHILVFTCEQREILESLRVAYEATLSKEAKKANSRAKIELLGDYSSQQKPEIATPKKKDDPASNQEWQVLVGRIKTCSKAFLAQQCGWKTPEKKDAHLQGE